MIKIYQDKSLKPGEILLCFLDKKQYWLLVDEENRLELLLFDEEGNPSPNDQYICDIDDETFRFIKKLCKIS